MGSQPAIYISKFYAFYNSLNGNIWANKKWKTYHYNERTDSLTYRSMVKSGAVTLNVKTQPTHGTKLLLHSSLMCDPLKDLIQDLTESGENASP